MPEQEKKCEACNGLGTREVAHSVGNTLTGFSRDRCHNCGGTGLSDPAAELAQMRTTIDTMRKRINELQSLRVTIDHPDQKGVGCITDTIEKIEKFYGPNAVGLLAVSAHTVSQLRTDCRTLAEEVQMHRVGRGTMPACMAEMQKFGEALDKAVQATDASGALARHGGKA